MAKPRTPDTQNDYFVLDPAHTDPKRVAKEREKARKLKKSTWWLTQINRGICHYCEKKFPPSQLTLDHVVPIARGGASNPGNVVPACHDCNRNKKLRTPVEDILESLDQEREKN